MIQYIYFIFSKQVQASRLEAEKDNVVVPTTMEEYCMKAKPLKPAQDRYVQWVQCDCGAPMEYIFPCPIYISGSPIN